MNARLIALVNDDPTFRHHATTALTARGYTVHACPDEPTAMRVIETERPAAVIVETRRGSAVSGIGLVEWLRGDAHDRTPVVVCSPDQLYLNQHAHAFREHRCAVVGRPFDPERLLDALGTIAPLAPTSDTYLIDGLAGG